MTRELVLATRNRHKRDELMALLTGLDVRVRTLDEFPQVHDVIEDGATCEENAIKKAREVSAATGVTAVADDTGLEVDALGGKPGVFAARYAGEDVTYEDNWRKLLNELSGVPRSQRTARFITVAAIVTPAHDIYVAHGTLAGYITETPQGTEGFGYDPVFYVPQFGKTLAELSGLEKNRISHRAQAFVHVRGWLEETARSPAGMQSDR
ncbi:Non-canonical purine NTP pyrophosphatase [Nitrospira sp. KM1]|uniref:XTP/dITP diphosphatase n=1 Tax=Nitrospira sp. KM1 TaxID=1936990 RepID=UPI0013A73350|nr:XTP/dITP diphosphatase [Nitrospira sp. KM1]BCA53318.1 Non-canonical purine NTP pyrophosphatase [Nitrospira sp. KM1]